MTKCIEPFYVKFVQNLQAPLSMPFPPAKIFDPYENFQVLHRYTRLILLSQFEVWRRHPMAVSSSKKLSGFLQVPSIYGNFIHTNVRCYKGEPSFSPFLEPIYFRLYNRQTVNLTMFKCMSEQVGILILSIVIFALHIFAKFLHGLLPSETLSSIFYVCRNRVKHS